MPNLNNRSGSAAPAVLIFDSGVGGLTVFREVIAARPDARFVYVADDAGFPYGNQPPDALIERIITPNVEAIAAYRPELIVIACNTASTIALAAVRAALDVAVVGTVPAIKPAAALSETRVIGVLGTNATVRQPYVDRLAAEFAADCVVLRHGSAELVDLAEAVLLEHRVGETFDAGVVDLDEASGHRPPGGTVAVDEPAVRARCVGSLPLGERIPVRLDTADPATRKVLFSYPG